MTLRCVLGKLAAQTPATEDELRAMRAAVWHKQGILVVNAEAVRDEWERQCVTNIGISRLVFNPPQATIFVRSQCFVFICTCIQTNNTFNSIAKQFTQIHFTQSACILV